MLNFPRNLWLERPAKVQGGGPAEAINCVVVFSKKNNRVEVRQRLSTAWRYSLSRTTGWWTIRIYQASSGGQVTKGAVVIKAANRELVNKVVNREVVIKAANLGKVFSNKRWSTRLPRGRCSPRSRTQGKRSTGSTHGW